MKGKELHGCLSQNAEQALPTSQGPLEMLLRNRVPLLQNVTRNLYPLGMIL